MSPITPALQYLKVSLAARYARARSEDAERGASVVEWVVITMIVVVIAIAVGALITNALESKAKQVCTSIDSSGGTSSGAKCS